MTHSTDTIAAHDGLTDFVETPSSRFRCVMLTDDTQIDRRILLQARTLQACGAEVILLAQGGGSGPDYVILEGIKIRRYYAPEASNSLSVKVLVAQQKFVNRLNNRSVKLQNRLNEKFGKRNGKLAGHTSKSEFFRAGLAHLSVRSILKFHTIKMRYTVTGPAGWSLKLARFLSRVIARLAKPAELDDHLAAMVMEHRPDVVHVHDLPQLAAGVKVKKFAKIPLIYDAHELYPEIGTLTPSQQKELGKREKRLIKFADAKSTVNPYIAEEMGKRYRIEAPKVIYNATSRPEGFQINDSRIRNAIGVHDNEQVLLFQGWYHESRGLKELISAMKLVRDGVHLVFLGYGQRAEGESLVSELGLTSKVHFLDRVPWDELLHWTTGADAGIIPYQKTDLNNYYCSPNKLFEFILAELPLISNDFPFLTDVIAKNEFGVTSDLSSEESFAAAINHMFDNKYRRWEKFRRALADNWQNWEWRTQEPILKEMYMSVGMPLLPEHIKTENE